MSSPLVGSCTQDSRLPGNNVVQLNSSDNAGEKEKLSQLNGELSRLATEKANANDKQSSVSVPSFSSKDNTNISFNTRPSDGEFTSNEDHDANEDPDALMIGVEIFEESDLDTDADNKLQLYSDVDTAVDECSHALASSITQAASVLTTSSDKSAAKNKRKNKTLREPSAPSRLSLEDRIRVIHIISRYNSYADAQKAWRQTYDTEPPCRKTMSTLDKKFQRTGSVADLVRTGRPKTTRTEAVIARVEEAVSKDPSKSIRTLAKELGIHQASVHRIKKEFEDKRNTLKMENRKLRDRLNDALKRIVLLEKRLLQTQTGGHTEVTSSAVLPSGMEPKYETLVITSPDGTGTAGLGSYASDQIDGHGGSNLPTIISLNNSNNQVLRLPPGQDTIHIITLPQGSSHHQVLSIDDSSSFQLSIPSNSPSGQLNNIATTSFLTSTSSSIVSNHEHVGNSFVSFN